MGFSEPIRDEIFNSSDFREERVRLDVREELGLRLGLIAVFEAEGILVVAGLLVDWAAGLLFPAAGFRLNVNLVRGARVCEKLSSKIFNC